MAGACAGTNTSPSSSITRCRLSRESAGSCSTATWYFSSVWALARQSAKNHTPSGVLNAACEKECPGTSNSSIPSGSEPGPSSCTSLSPAIKNLFLNGLPGRPP